MKKLLMTAAALLVLATPAQAQPDLKLIYWEVNWKSMTMDQCVATIDAELAKHGRELPYYDMLEACDTLLDGAGYHVWYFWPRRGTEAWARMDKCRQEFIANTPRFVVRQMGESRLVQMCDRSTR